MKTCHFKVAKTPQKLTNRIYFEQHLKIYHIHVQRFVPLITRFHALLLKVLRLCVQVLVRVLALVRESSFFGVGFGEFWWSGATFPFGSIPGIKQPPQLHVGLLVLEACTFVTVQAISICGVERAMKMLVQCWLGPNICR